MQDTDEFDHLAELREAVRIENLVIDMYEGWLASIPESIKRGYERVAVLENRIARGELTNTS